MKTSQDGFYCFLSRPLVPGERIECDIVIPTHVVQRAKDVLSMRCRAQVLRVEKTEHGYGYGLACRIEDYHVMHVNLTEPEPERALCNQHSTLS